MLERVQSVLRTKRLFQSARDITSPLAFQIPANSPYAQPFQRSHHTSGSFSSATRTAQPSPRIKDAVPRSLFMSAQYRRSVATETAFSRSRTRCGLNCATTSTYESALSRRSAQHAQSYSSRGKTRLRGNRTLYQQSRHNLSRTEQIPFNIERRHATKAQKTNPPAIYDRTATHPSKSVRIVASEDIQPRRFLS